MFLCAQTLMDVVERQQATPEDSSALKSALNGYLTTHHLHRHHFHSRTPADNTQAAQNSRLAENNAAQGLYRPPPAASPGLRYWPITPTAAAPNKPRPPQPTRIPAGTTTHPT